MAKTNLYRSQGELKKRREKKYRGKKANAEESSRNIIIKVIPAVPYIIIKLQYVVNRLNSVFYVCEKKTINFMAKMPGQSGKFSVR